MRLPVTVIAGIQRPPRTLFEVMLMMLEGLCYFQTSSIITTSAAQKEIKNWVVSNPAELLGSVTALNLEILCRKKI